MNDSPSTPRHALITGANTGIGRVTAVALASAGITVFLACRSAARVQPVLQEIEAKTGRRDRAHPLPLDLGDLDSVADCAEQFTRLDLPLHWLVNNAGVAGDHGLTRQGFELAFGVNHLGHFLLTRLLLPSLRRADHARVVTVASRAHHLVRHRFDWDSLRQPTRTMTGVHEYAVSKLANVLFSAELSRRLGSASISTYSLHPGVVGTEVWRHAPWWSRPLLKLRPMLTPEAGARTTLHCCLDAPPGETGGYYSDGRRARPSRLAEDVALAQALWERSETMIGR